MDTEEKYLDDKIYVTMSGETPPDKIVEVERKNHEERVKDPDNPLVGPEEYEPSPSRDHAPLGEKPSVDGWVTFYDPDKLERGVPFKHYTFGFRDVNKDDEPWFCYPDRSKWDRQPIWEWTNPEQDPHGNLTLNPSLGIGKGDITFHCFIKNGEIDWL